MTRGAASYLKAVKFLYALLDGVQDTEYLEIRTIKKVGGAREKFYSSAMVRSRALRPRCPATLTARRTSTTVSLPGAQSG